ncbi:ADP-ribosyltransferase domain-containing protein [Streptomyces sp. NPDC014676]|uniref:ADP-ribosyltransferase domain-containing protein n=1 Tax=Streptomyces sp. NPDC014676 TaxID=3364879 RepID=UPI00370165D7
MPDVNKVCFVTDADTARKIRQHTDKVTQLKALIEYYTQKEAAEQRTSASPDRGVFQRTFGPDEISLHGPGEAPPALTRDAGELSAAKTAAAVAEETAHELRNIADSTGQVTGMNRLAAPAQAEPAPMFTADDAPAPSQRVRPAPVYPIVDPAVRARWADRFAEAREVLESLPEAKREQLLEQAAQLMSGRHQPPPIDRAGAAEGSPEAEYAALFDDMAAVIAARVHSEPRPDSVEEWPPSLLSEELRTEFGTRAVTGLPGGMWSTSHSTASSSRQGQQSSSSARFDPSLLSYGKMGPEFETEWIIDQDLSHGDRLAQLGPVTLTAERLRSDAPTTLEIVGAPIAFRGEADGVPEDDIWRSLDTVMRSLRPGPAVKHLFRGQSGFRALEHGGAGLARVAPGRESSLSPQWTVGMPASELLDFIMDDVKALSVKSADTAHADAEAGAAFAKETAALYYSATRRTTITNPWLAWEILDDADYRSVAGLLLLVFLQAITPVHVEDNRNAGKKSGNWFKSYTFIASRHDPRTLADALPPHARDFLNENHSSVLRSFSKHARSALSDRYSGNPLDASLLYKGLTVRDYVNSFLLRNPYYAVSQEIMGMVTVFGKLDGGKPLVELRNLADVEGVAQAREQYEDLKRRALVRYEAGARRTGLPPGHHVRLHAMQTELASSELAGSLERLLRITGELNLAHHQRALGFELVKRTAVKPLVRSLLRLHNPVESGTRGAEQDRSHVSAVLQKLDADLTEFAYTLNLFDHAGRSWDRVKRQWAQAMQDTATLRQALSQEPANWPPPEAMQNWKEISALPGMRPRTNLKNIDSAVREALSRPGDTAALQDILFQITDWRGHHPGSKREGAIERLERHVLHQLAGRPEHIARPSAPRQGMSTTDRQRPGTAHHTSPAGATSPHTDHPRYPVPSPEALEEWSDRIRYARDYLREVPDAGRLRQQAASIVTAHHLAPPHASERLTEDARTYREYYEGAVDVVASLLGRDRTRSQPDRRAVQAAQDMAEAFGSARTSHTAVPLGGAPFAAPQPPVQNLAEHMARMGLQAPSTSAPQAAGSHVRAYPPVNTVVVQRWQARFSSARQTLASLADQQQLLEAAAPIVARYHISPPSERSGLPEAAQNYQNLYSNIVYVVAAQLFADRRSPQPAYQAHVIAQQAANEFGTVRRSAASTSLHPQVFMTLTPPASDMARWQQDMLRKRLTELQPGSPEHRRVTKVLNTWTPESAAPTTENQETGQPQTASSWQDPARTGLPADRAPGQRSAWKAPELLPPAFGGRTAEHVPANPSGHRHEVMTSPSVPLPRTDNLPTVRETREDSGHGGSVRGTATGEPQPVLRLRGGGPGGSQSERDIIDHWIAESDRLGRSRSGKLQDIDRAVEAWMTGGREHPLAFEQNKWELQAIDLAIGAWLAEPHGSARTAAVERLRQRVRQELTASDMLSRSFPYLAVPGYRTNHEERQSFRTGFADYQLHRQQMPSGSYFRRIPEEDLVALIAYTGITEFSAVNQALRTGDRRALAGYASLIKSSISGLNQLAPHTGTVYRGISLNPAQTQAALARYAPGRVVQEPAFVSTNAFAPRFSGNIQFEIESRSGRSVQAISRHKNVENEVLFPPGTSFQVQSVQDQGGIWTIRMTEVAPAQDSPPAAEPSSLARQGEPLPWVDASGWRKIGEKLGSNVGGTYEDARGHRFYLKLARTPDHARNEVLAAALYRLAGVQVPELRLITREGKYGTASRFIENAHQDLERKLKDKSYRKAVYDGFAVDAWLANWDVAGRYYDNIVNVGGNPVRIDTGGALMYSGKGDLKGNRFASNVTEWNNLRDYTTNPQTFEVFKDITAKAMQESARRVIAITPQQIDAAIDSVGFSDRTTAYLKTTLKARRIDVARLAGLPLPTETAGPAGRTPIAAPAPSSAFTSTPGQYRGPQAPLTASQMLAMVNRQPAEPSTDIPALTQQFSHVGLSRTNTGIEPPQASGSRLPAYPLVDRALLDQWRGKFSEERAALRSLPDGQNWLTTAARLVARDHVAPPSLGSTMSAPEQAYQELYSGIVYVVAARLHRDRARQHPQERAHALSLELGSTFGTLLSQAAPTRGARTQQWSEPAPGIDSGELIGDGRGFGAATGFAGVEDSSRAMRIARELIDVPAEVERPLAARAEAARLIGLLLHDDVVAERVAGSDVRVVIVPRSRHLADLPPYAGTQGEDRPPVSARGWTDQQRAVVAVSEENLLGQEAADADRTHPEGYSSVLHEAAHLVYAFGLEDARRARVEEAFSTRRGAATPRQWVDGPLRDLHGNPSTNHSSSDAAEYFAQSTVAYFGANHGRDSITHQQRNNGAAWLAEHDPVLNSLLHELYGPPPAEPLHANALSVTAADQSMWEALNWHTTNTEGRQDSARQVPGTAAHARQHSFEEPVGSGVTETVPSVEGTGPVGSRDTLRAPEPETAQTPQRPARTEQGRLVGEDSAGVSGPHEQTAPVKEPPTGLPVPLPDLTPPTPLVAFLDAPHTNKSRSTRPGTETEGGSGRLGREVFDRHTESAELREHTAGQPADGVETSAAPDPDLAKDTTAAAVTTPMDAWNALASRDSERANLLMVFTLGKLPPELGDMSTAVKKAYSELTRAEIALPVEHQANLLTQLILAGTKYPVKGGAPLADLFKKKKKADNSGAGPSSEARTYTPANATPHWSAGTSTAPHWPAGTGRELQFTDPARMQPRIPTVAVRTLVDHNQHFLGADYTFHADDGRMIDTRGFVLHPDGTHGSHRLASAPWGSDRVFLVRATWDEEFHKIVVREDGEFAGKSLQEFAELVGRNPALTQVHPQMAIAILVEAQDPSTVWNLARLTAFTTRRAVWFSSQRPALGTSPLNASHRAISISGVKAARWAKVLPQDWTGEAPERHLTVHPQRQIRDTDIRVDVVVDYETKRPIGVLSHSLWDTQNSEESFMTLSGFRQYSQGLVNKNEIPRIAGTERPVPWPRDAFFWVSHGQPGWVILEANLPAGGQYHVSGKEFGGYLRRLLRTQPLRAGAPIVLVVCHGASVAHDVAQATGRVVYAADMRVGANFTIAKEPHGHDHLWMRFEPQRLPQHPGTGVITYPVIVSSASGEAVSKQALRAQLEKMTPGTAQYERVTRALASWEHADRKEAARATPGTAAGETHDDTSLMSARPRVTPQELPSWMTQLLSDLMRVPANLQVPPLGAGETRGERERLESLEPENEKHNRTTRVLDTRTAAPDNAPSAVQGTDELLVGIEDRFRPAVRRWNGPFVTEVERLTRILRVAGSRSLVFGITPDDPIWAVNDGGSIVWRAKDTTVLPAPQEAAGPVASIDIHRDGYLIGPAASAVQKGAVGFCDLNLGADPYKVLGGR